jgi:hypothetical protein
MNAETNGEHALLLRIARNSELETATRLVEQHFYGELAVFARRAFDDINLRFFGGRLPWTLILWGLTAHGHCLGVTYSNVQKPPIITLHPSLLGGREKESPWGIPARYLGQCYAYEVLLHECMHVSVHYLLGGEGNGESSHNNPAWVAEVNRIAPLLGLTGVNAAITKPMRIKGEAKVKRGTLGNVPLDLLSRFPHSLRVARGECGFYERGILPWQAGCNVLLDVTVSATNSAIQNAPEGVLLGGASLHMEGSL